MVEKQGIYKNIEEKNLKKLLHDLQSTTHLYTQTETIAYSISGRNIIGIMESGNANLVRFDYDGVRTIIDELAEGDIFSDMFVETISSELSVIATTKCKVTFIEYNELLKKCKSNENAIILLNNLFKNVTKKLIKRNERIELLTTRSIRNKLLSYFELQAKKNNSKSFNLRYTYTDLADYLAIDRSAMMRELKNLKDDKLITDINKKITINIK